MLKQGFLSAIHTRSKSTIPTASSTTIMAGTVDFTGNNSAIGATVNVQGGAVQVGTGGSINSATALTLGSGTSSGLLVLGDVNGAVNQTVASLTTSGTGTPTRCRHRRFGPVIPGPWTINDSSADALCVSVIGGTWVPTSTSISLVKTGAEPR